MTTENISEVICCVNALPIDNDMQKMFRAVYYMKDADLRTFKHSNSPSERMIKVWEDVKGSIGPWEPWGTSVCNTIRNPPKPILSGWY
jgi:hypothetical protein